MVYSGWSNGQSEGTSNLFPNFWCIYICIYLRWLVSCAFFIYLFSHWKPKSMCSIFIYRYEIKWPMRMFTWCITSFWFFCTCAMIFLCNNCTYIRLKWSNSCVRVYPKQKRLVHKIIDEPAVIEKCQTLHQFIVHIWVLHSRARFSYIDCDTSMQ